MRIVFVSMRSPLTYLGGAEILTLLVARGLAARGHSVSIYTAGHRKQVIIDGVRVVQTPLLFFPQTLRTTLLFMSSQILQLFFERMSDFTSADIVHAIDSDSIVLMSGWKFLRKKFVVTIQDYNLLQSDKDYWAESRHHAIARTPLLAMLTKYVRRKIANQTIQHIQRAVCVSKYVAHTLNSINTHVQIAVISNCVPDDWLQHGIGMDRDIDILYVGKLVTYKGLDVLLAAMKKITKKRSCRLYVIGDGFREVYETQAKKMGLQDEIIFVGTTPHQFIQHYYLQAKIVVSPSLWPEPCGRTIIEGMASGCPIVATNIGGTPESFIDTQHGHLVPSGRPDAIATACSYLLGHEKIRMRMGRAAFTYAKRAYSEHKISREYEKFYSLIKSYRLL